jgi:ComEC/Rec2-related protein
LLVVSGENVAFALALAGPMLRRLPLSWRLLAGLVVLGLFGVLTRWEPSVLRAEAMAAIAMTASAIGRPVSTIRLLAIAVTGLLLIDPLLVGSVGFLLSVGACAGIALFAQPLAASLPGPRAVASATGVTLAAQAGVAPVLLPAFGALPVATLPANLLAMPAAGPVMVWGMLAGVPAGLVGGWPAAVLHLPTRVLVGWIALVARTTARAPLGRLGFGGLVVIGACVAVAVGFRRARTVGLAGAVAALCAPAVALALTRPPPVDGREVVPGARLWRAGGATVLVIDHPRPDRLLGALRAGGVTRLTVLVARSTGTRTAQVVEPLLHRLHVDAMLEPGVPAGSTIRAGPYVITVKATRPKLDVTIEAPGTGR